MVRSRRPGPRRPCARRRVRQPRAAAWQEHRGGTTAYVLLIKKGAVTFSINISTLIVIIKNCIYSDARPGLGAWCPSHTARLGLRYDRSAQSGGGDRGCFPSAVLYTTPHSERSRSDLNIGGSGSSGTPCCACYRYRKAERCMDALPLDILIILQSCLIKQDEQDEQDCQD